MSFALLVAKSPEIGVQLAMVRVGEGGNFIARATKLSAGTRLELFDQYRGRDFRFELHVGEAPRIEISGASSRLTSDQRLADAWWAMDAAAGPQQRESIVSIALDWSRRSLDAVVVREGNNRADDAVEDPRRVQVATWLASVAEVVRAAELAAIARCDEHALSLALQFLPELRFRIYARLVGDRSGRLAQLVSSCPGAWIFGLALLEQRDVSLSVRAGEQLFADVIAGRSLDTALDAAIERQFTCASESRARYENASSDYVSDYDRQVIAVHAFDPTELPQLRARQRLLIRRAGTRVSTVLLFQRPPMVVIPEDIPRTADENATWFRVMAGNEMVVTRWLLRDDTQARRRSIAEFLSRHAQHFAGDEHDRLDRLYAYAEYTGCWPTRNSNPERVFEECAEWHLQLHVRELADSFDISESSVAGIRLPVPPIDPIHCGFSSIDLRPIDMAVELIREGQEMHHCVATRVNEAIDGTVFIFAGTVNRERVTIELIQKRGKWCLGDARRAHNHRPSETTIAMIEAWAAAAARQLDANQSREKSRTASTCDVPAA